MQIPKFVKISEKFVTDNSPAILTAIGVVGTISTAVLTARATITAIDIIEQEKGRYSRTGHTSFGAVPQDADSILTKKQHVQLLWKVYAPPIAMAALTTSAIVCANRVGTRRAAAMATAYGLSEKAFSEYKEKVVEQLGANKEQKIRDEIAQDRVAKNPPSSSIMIEDDQSLFYDKYTGRYFISTMETVKAAQNHVNHQLLSDGHISLNTFYSWLSLDSIPLGEEVGWKAMDPLELVFSATIADNGKPAIVVDFRVEPVRKYDSAFG